MSPRKRKIYDDDDGRTIAEMNVDGMPWYVRARERPAGNEDAGREELSRSEKRAMLFGVLKASMLVGGVYIVVFLAFILFCINVWFK